MNTPSSARRELTTLLAADKMPVMQPTRVWLALVAGVSALMAISGVALRGNVAVAQGHKGMPVLWLYGDVNGETHFKNIEVDLSQMIAVGGARRDKPAGDSVSELIATRGIQFRRADAGQDHGTQEKGWTRPRTPTPPGRYMIMLKGQIEIATTDGDKRVLGPGDILLEDDIGSKGHTGRAITTDRQQLFISLVSTPGQTPQPVPSSR
jgi:hypothetical protein